MGATNKLFGKANIDQCSCNIGLLGIERELLKNEAQLYRLYTRLEVFF